MFFNIVHVFQKPSFLKVSGFLACCMLPPPTLAIQPMTESDLEIVSAISGSNILNIFGASQAGLKIDDSISETTEASSVQLSSENFNEGEATKPVALSKLRTIEEDVLQAPNNNELVLPEDTQDTVLTINKQTIGKASLFSTNSEINYKTSNVNYEMRRYKSNGYERNVQKEAC